MGVVNLLVLLVASVAAHEKESHKNPVERVVQLIEGLKAKIIADGTAEQQVYDKYACWCEKTTARKAAAIENAKQLIDELSKSILELKGRLGSYVPEIQKLEKDIGETKQAIEEAEAQRKKEAEEYLKKKAALELGLANLEKAIKVLAEATVDATPNLLKPDENRDAQAETKLLTVMAGVRSALVKYNSLSEKNVDKSDVGTLKTFLSSPNPSLMETRANPAAATYSSQSGQIQGILAQMKDDFEAELKSSAEEEAAAAEAHESLMETKRENLALLEKTLTKTKVNQGNDEKQLAEDSQEREETQAQLKADEAFFEETKASCKAKADQWAGRARSRTEELAAIDQALAVLTSEESKAIFKSSHETMFLQIAHQTAKPAREKAFNILKSVSVKTDSLRLAAIASSVATGWHFDAVIADIDKMITALREEEKADIEHKDWCEAQQSAANSKNENLEYDKEQLGQKKQRAEDKKAELEAEVEATEAEMADIEKAMQDALDTRNKEHEAFQKALKDDADAVMLIGKAIEALDGFYNKALIQQPEYKANEDTAPETFSGDYEGRKSEGGGVIAILSMIKEDIENEIKHSRMDEAEDLAAYEKLRTESQASLTALEEKKVSLNQDIAGKMRDISGIEAVLEDKENSKTATDDLLKSLKPNCDWIARTFDMRMEKRKAEMEGLSNAKNVLAGAAPDAAMVATMVATQRRAGHGSVDDELKALDSSERKFEKSFLQRA